MERRNHIRIAERRERQGPHSHGRPDDRRDQDTATLSVGSAPDTYTWELGYANPAGEAIVFVTSGSYSTNLGGLSGADSKCTSAATAAGYSGSWTAIPSDSATAAINRLPFNWATLKRTDGAVVASGWADLWDGSIQNTISLDQNGNNVGQRNRHDRYVEQRRNCRYQPDL